MQGPLAVFYASENVPACPRFRKCTSARASRMSRQTDGSTPASRAASAGDMRMPGISYTSLSAFERAGERRWLAQQPVKLVGFEGTHVIAPRLSQTSEATLPTLVGAALRRK